MAIALDLRLPPDPASCAEARDKIAELRGRLDEETIEDAELLTSELVTNSVRHAQLHPGDVVHLVAEVEPEALRVRVSDPGPGFRPGPGKPVPRPLGGGWGLVLLDRIADRWGVEEGPGLATAVWFELRRRARRARAEVALDRGARGVWPGRIVGSRNAFHAPSPPARSRFPSTGSGPLS